LPGAGGRIPTADGIYGAVEAAIENAVTVRQGTGTRTDTVVPNPSVQPNPAIPQDTSREAIIRRATNGVKDLMLKTRKRALRRRRPRLRCSRALPTIVPGGSQISRQRKMGP
jgi:hypothetical protein